MARYWRAMVLVLTLLLAAVVATAAGAAAVPGVRAFLDRSHVSLGDIVTLNIESSGDLGTPDLAPLRKDFSVLGSSRSSSVQIVDGKTTRKSLLGIALKPLHAGTLAIPALAVGTGSTAPLTLQVAAAPTGGTGTVGDPVFMEAEVQSGSPWVGQQTVYTVRLFYLPGVDGALGDPAADGARLIPFDRDHRYLTARDGYTYRVIERRWALIPTRSGAITVRGPQFQGQRMAAIDPNNFFNNPYGLRNTPNALLNGQIPGFGKPVRAAAPSVQLDARPVPANARKPWLPARALQLHLTGLPANGEATVGVPVTVTLSISATGQPADALPQPELPTLPDAEVYPDQTRDATDDAGEWLQGSRTRSFAIVPRRDGTLSIPAITLDWFDVVRGRPAQAVLPARTLRVVGAVAAVAPGAASPPAAGAAVGSTVAVPPMATAASVVAAPSLWRVAALASVGLWLVVVIAGGVWWWRARRVFAGGSDAPAIGEPVPAGGAGSATNPDDVVESPAVAAAKPDPRALQRRALDAARAGDAAECERALLAWARASRVELTNLGALRDALSGAAQRDALDALQRARWQGGDAVAAGATVASAFERGIAWRDDGRGKRTRDGDLPPLYPPS